MPATPVSEAEIGDPASMQAAVLSWYATHGRRLNFRTRRDAYAVLVSEAMAQQTQISRVEPAWEAFLARFPTVEALAAAPVANVLRAWQGMGYNRRALNLQKAARVVVEEFGGRFPESIEALERLPGVGPYTARAVAAIAFGQRVGAVDTNVRRVLGRAAGGWAGLPPARLQARADEMVPPGLAAEWTHALMDIGARFCRPRGPVCGECPVLEWCVAGREGVVAVSPADAGRPPAGGGSESGRRRSRAAPLSARSFPTTSRWLRGRLIDRARAAEADAWVRVDGPIQAHDEAAVEAAVRALTHEGLLERHPTDPALVRLPR